ncbi:hypothetical protein J4228_00110 [Candidatus Woesearchaeota archaeon]|nr:hypothetical protein [Candidatus Woesearchaeota archaeon]
MVIEHMYERDLVINNRELHYKGIFITNELFSIINRALEEKGYEKREKKTEEIVAQTGKRTFIELRPYKVKTNYAVLMIKMKITLDNITETVETIREEKRKFQQGDVSIIFDSWMLTSYEGKWVMKPWVYFLKGIINKYVYTFPLEKSFRRELVADTAYIYAQIKRLLNTYKVETGKVVREEDVRRKIEEEMRKEIEERE